jgi:dockerin type I repeat protein
MRREMVLPAVMILIGAAAARAGRPDYYAAWVKRYPTSTIPHRMSTVLGLECYTCHQPSIGAGGTCYREDIKALIEQQIPIEVALDMVEPLDSDGDGVPNGVEILTPRAGAPDDVGYHPGLRGDTGLSPCAGNPFIPLTGQDETPCRADWDASGAVNSSDISAYLGTWLEAPPGGGGGGDPPLRTDMNGDGAINSADISAYLTAWLAALGPGGC